MYKKKLANKTTIKVNTSYEGETLEKKINRIVNNKEPIKDGAPIIYTERKEGVRPEYDVRTDRWEEALGAMDLINKAKIAERDQRRTDKEAANISEQAKQGMLKENGGTEPIQTNTN
jgi:hypothetical protein